MPRIDGRSRRLNYNNTDNFVARPELVLPRFIVQTKLGERLVAAQRNLRGHPAPAAGATSRARCGTRRRSSWSAAGFFLIYRNDLQLGNRAAT